MTMSPSLTTDAPAAGDTAPKVVFQGVHLRVDANGTVHITGGRIHVHDCILEVPPGGLTAAALCVHRDGEETCPSDTVALIRY